VKLTKVSSLIAYAVAAGLIGYAVSLILVRIGQPLPSSPTNLLVTLPVISVVLVILAIPVVRYQTAIKKNLALPAGAKPVLVKRVDPFYALRVALLSKAVAISGSIFLGWHGGVLVAVLTSPQISESAAWRSAFGIAGSLTMVIAGIIIERACRVPPDSTATDTEATAA
jgi:hypothetical protein